MVQLAHIHGEIVVQGSLHSLGLEAATAGSGFLDLLTHVEVGSCIASRGLQGEQWICQDVWRFIVLGTLLVEDASTLWIYYLLGTMCLRSGGS
jgi:hypothetical protein